MVRTGFVRTGLGAKCHGFDDSLGAEGRVTEVPRSCQRMKDYQGAIMHIFDWLCFVYMNVKCGRK